MRIIFFVSLSVLLYIYIGYPLTLFLLSWLFRKTVQKKEIIPSVSLIISAYNEERIIGQKIENTLALDYPKDKLEIIVASESTDKTNDIVRSYQSKNVLLYAYDQREGKRATLFRTVPLAQGEIIVFSDANAMYDKNAIKNLIRNFNDKRIGCVSGRLTYVNPNESMIGISETTYWEFDLFLKKFASRMFRLGGGVNGSIFAIRKELYNPIDKYRGDDFEIACRIELAGHGAVFEPEAVSYEESSQNSKQEFKRKVRLATWNMISATMLLKEACVRKKWLTAYILISHRLLRYFSSLWLIGLGLSNLFLTRGLLGYFLIAQLIFYLLAGCGWAMEKKSANINLIFRIPFYFCLVNYAGFLSLFKVLTKKTEMHWEKVR